MSKAGAKAGVDTGRRRMLTMATSAVGAVGAGAWAVPFVGSLAPSERAKALGAPVEVDISDLKPGDPPKIVSWRGQAVFIVKRSPEMLASLEQVTGGLRDPDSEEPQQPDYVKKETRSIKPEVLVMKGVCTHLGCSPKFRPEETKAADVGMDWKGGFFCPCHGSKFDLAGRVYQGVPAPLNIAVPPHRYTSDNVLVIGEDPDQGGNGEKKKEVA
jgi:ubiquinol-cytochrome c reductase iron-sulfur subunit